MRVFEEIAIDHRRCRCLVDGRVYASRHGAWATYIPELEVKVLHASGGTLLCLHPSAPKKVDAIGTPRDGRYRVEDWQRALTRSVLERACENHAIARRLHRYGLGPRSDGVAFVRRLADSSGLLGGFTAAVHVADIDRLPDKSPATAADLAAAGVIPDRIGSCLRQQIRGYVSDLNSVVGVTLDRYEEDIPHLLAELEELARERAGEGGEEPPGTASRAFLRRSGRIQAFRSWLRSLLGSPR